MGEKKRGERGEERRKERREKREESYIYKERFT